MLTQEYLKSILHYNPETGIFTRLTNVASNCYKKGEIAGGLNFYGYERIGIDKKRYLTHRLAWLYVYGYIPTIIDHINGNPADNRLCNLREATFSENQLNKKVKHNKKEPKNVFWDKSRNKWQVKLKVNKKEINFGRFDDFFEACCIAFSARNRLHGEFVNHGKS